MNPSKLNSIFALILGFASVVGVTYQKEIGDYVQAHPAISMAAGFLVVLYNNLVKPVHKS